MTVTYCRSWNTLLDQPIDKISEEIARTRFEKGPWFTVVIDGDGGVPRATIELEKNASTAKVFRFSSTGSIEMIETYDRIGDQMFLSEMVIYQYPDDKKHRQSESILMETFRFQTDGVVRRITDDKSQPDIHVEDRRNIDVSLNWRTVPSFGNWETLAREIQEFE